MEQFNYRITWLNILILETVLQQSFEHFLTNYKLVSMYKPGLGSEGQIEVDLLLAEGPAVHAEICG